MHITLEWLKRLEDARSILFINGFLTGSEDQKVRFRIKKACDKSGLKVKLVSPLKGGRE